MAEPADVTSDVTGDIDRAELGRVDADALLLDTTELQAAEPVSRRRRPTGEPPPLPAEERWRGYRWLIVALVAAAGSFVVFAYQESGWALSADQRVAEWFATTRTGSSVAAARVVEHLSDDIAIRVLRWGTIAVLLIVRRLRHLAVFVSAILVVEWVATAMNFVIARPRPMVEILGSWDGFSHPSRPLAALAVTLIGMTRVLIPSGERRRVATSAVMAVLTVVAAARVVLGVDHVSDTLVGAAIGVGIGLVAFRLLAPSSIVPVFYRRGETAHLDVEGARRDAIVAACRDQLGLDVVGVELHGEEGSAGSTPLRLRVRSRERPYVFAKLYSRQHLRSDRSYKLVRTLLYGQLEDEAPFATVRRLVMYEDHMTRALRDAEVPVPDVIGIAEITPEREYLIAFDFLRGEELADVEVDEDLISDGMRVIQKLWAGGFAHRDIKPSNVMVSDGRIRLVDTAFAQMRPSPWRQAVDLGAMMLVLALRSDADTVHRVARRFFSEEEIGEAMAATSPSVIPRQLRTMLDEDGRELLERFRALSPGHPPIRVQRWGGRRLALLAATVAAAGLAGYLAWVGFRTAGML